MRRVLVLVFLMLPAVARAQVAVTVALSPDGQALASQLGIMPSDLADKIKTNIDDAYDTANVGKFLRSFTDATSFSMRGMGVDYMSLPHNFMLGVGGQVALATDGEISAKERPTNGGVAANLSIMAGLNLGDWGIRGGRCSATASIATNPPTGCTATSSPRARISSTGSSIPSKTVARPMFSVGPASTSPRVSSSRGGRSAPTTR